MISLENLSRWTSLVVTSFAFVLVGCEQQSQVDEGTTLVNEDEGEEVASTQQELSAICTASICSFDGFTPGLQQATMDPSRRCTYAEVSQTISKLICGVPATTPEQQAVCTFLQTEIPAAGATLQCSPCDIKSYDASGMPGWKAGRCLDRTDRLPDGTPFVTYNGGHRVSMSKSPTGNFFFWVIAPDRYTASPASTATATSDTLSWLNTMTKSYPTRYSDANVYASFLGFWSQSQEAAWTLGSTDVPTAFPDSATERRSKLLIADPSECGTCSLVKYGRDRVRWDPSKIVDLYAPALLNVQWSKTGVVYSMKLTISSTTAGGVFTWYPGTGSKEQTTALDEINWFLTHLAAFSCSM